MEWKVKDKSKGMHRKELNGIEIGKRRNGIVSYRLSNLRGDDLGMEIQHFLESENYILRRGTNVETCSPELVRRWREKGTVKAEGDIGDITVDLLGLGDKIFI